MTENPGGIATQPGWWVESDTTRTLRLPGGGTAAAYLRREGGVWNVYWPSGRLMAGGFATADEAQAGTETRALLQVGS